MRIIHVTPYFAPAFGFGGPPQSILGLCKALVQTGTDVEVFTTTANPGGELPANVTGTCYDGVPVRYFPIDAPRLLLGSRALWRALDAAAPQRDVIHVHGLFNATSWAAAHVARRHRRPLVVSVRGMLQPAALRHHRARKSAAWKLFDHRTVSQAAMLHCTSNEERKSIEGLTHLRSVVVPNPVNVASDDVTDMERSELRRRLEIPDEARIVLFLGRLHVIKRLDLLGAAFARVARRVPDAYLVIAGGGEAARALVESPAGAVAKRIRWVGPVYHRNRDVLLSTASVLALCSDSENFGMSVAEALSAGVPVVVTQTCPWEIVERAGAGRWVRQDADAIAEALLDVLRDRNQALEMGVRGRALAAQHFAPGLIAERWRNVYAQLGAA
jgi:glycosyltransferase involved in cell wall biosynthesis